MSARQLRVVLVDDSPDMRELARIVLCRAGHQVVGEAGDGASGVLVARGEDPDLVVIDLEMPVMDGYTALPLMRLAVPEARIVVFSHDVSIHNTALLRDLGADDSVRKGVPLAQVLRILEGNLGLAARGALEGVE